MVRPLTSCSNIVIMTCINTLCKIKITTCIITYDMVRVGGYLKDEKAVFSSVTACRMNLKSGGNSSTALFLDEMRPVP